MAHAKKHLHKHREPKDDERKKQRKERRNKYCKQFGAFMMTVLLWIRYFLDHFIDKIFSLYYNSRVQRIQGSVDPLLLESATSLSRKIRRREVTSEQIVQAFIDQIRNVNPLLNAVIDDRFDEAIEEAKRIDNDIAIGTILDVDFQQKPFLGIPFTTKESTAVKGLSHTFGLVNRKGYKAKFDATVVEFMKDAGGILIAVTNVPQLNLWQETSNPLYGITNNPYNTTRNVGGSSGGEASIIAACGSPLGIGTDIGGSLRIPSFMCGVFGHKPSCDLVSTCGLTFRTGKEKDTMVVAGPMTKHAEDIIPMLKVLLGSNVDQLKLDTQLDIEKIKVFYVKTPNDPLISMVRDEMRKIFERVVNHFTEILPEEPQPLELEELRYGGKIWRYWMSQEPNAVLTRDLTNREGEINSLLEIAKFCVGQSNFNAAKVLGSDAVLLYPSGPWPANYHHTALLRPWNFQLFAIWNALKFPVTQVPLGLSVDGLPLGIQVVAAPHQDHLSIAVAKELERAFGGYVPPFKIKE